MMRRRRLRKDLRNQPRFVIGRLLGESLAQSARRLAALMRTAVA